MYGFLLFAHVLSATIWTGGHLVLAAVVLPRALRRRDPSVLSEFESAYERLGLPALLIQVGTGLWLAHRLSPHPADWLRLDDPASRGIAAKLILLLLTVLLAADARLRLIPRLSKDNLTALAWHIVPVTILSILFVAAGVGLRAGWFL